MNLFLLIIVFFSILGGCNKQNTDINNHPLCRRDAAPIIDPQNLLPDGYQKNGNAVQMNYGSIMAVKSINVILKTITPGDMAIYKAFIYVRLRDSYVHLPTVTPRGVHYTYKLEVGLPFCSATIVRPEGTGELLEDVIIILAKRSYLLTIGSPLNFSDYGTVKLKLGF